MVSGHEGGMKQAAHFLAYRIFILNQLHIILYSAQRSRTENSVHFHIILELFCVKYKSIFILNSQLQFNTSMKMTALWDEAAQRKANEGVKPLSQEKSMRYGARLPRNLENVVLLYIYYLQFIYRCFFSNLDQPRMKGW